MSAMTVADVLRELDERCEKAAAELDDLARKAAVPEFDRLRGKAQGVRLTLSYVEDIERRLLAQP